MTVLILGAQGSMGRRYTAILNSLGVSNIGIDLGDPIPNDFDRAIIATPTPTHNYLCNEMIVRDKPFLCEKPLSVNLVDCERLAQVDIKKRGSVVNNWKFCFDSVMEEKWRDLYYNYYNTGKDGLYWDACQLIYLDPNVIIKNESVVWKAKCNNRWISYDELERSYVYMIESWLNDAGGLWDLEDGLRMTQAVLNRMERDKCAA